MQSCVFVLPKFLKMYLLKYYIELHQLEWHDSGNDNHASGIGYRYFRLTIESPVQIKSYFIVIAIFMTFNIVFSICNLLQQIEVL